MDIPTILAAGQALVASWAKDPANPEPNRLDVSVTPGELLEAVRALVERHWGYLSAITGLDLGAEAAQLEVLYHFCSGPAVLTLRVRLPYAGACLPSVCGLLPAASLYERELMEMFGVTVTGTPNPTRLFLPDDWPDGVYPLRKSFNPQETLRREIVTGSLDEPGQPGKFVIPIGPQHPALKEPGRFEFTVDGEIVTAASVRLGYVHRGIEKACEQRNWTQDLYLLERICGICSHHHAYAYSLAVEQLAHVEAPPRAQAIRELVAGLERIHSHLLWLGVAAHEAGFDTLFMYSWRDRETVMDILEALTGNRVNYSANVLGGVKCDVDARQHKTMHTGLDYLEKRASHYLEIVTTDAAFLQRTRGVGTTTYEQAQLLGIIGPTARASGLTRDIRVEAPYGSYTHFPISVVTETAGEGRHLAHLPAPGRDGRPQQRQHEGRLVREDLGQGAGRAEHREAVAGIGSRQPQAQRQQAEQVQRHDQVAGQAVDRAQPGQRHIQGGRQRAGQGRYRQGVEQEPVHPGRHDLLFAEQLHHVGQRLEPARADPVLKLGHQLAVDPLVGQPAKQDEQPAGEE
ncbi:MAG TPA: NADH-quinone oxidoreductase subunit C [Anaerolineales bacterium]